MKVVVATGVAQGIGRALIDRFASWGAILYIVDQNAEMLDGVRTSLQERRVEVRARVLDVSDESAVEDLFREVEAQHGRLDVLINNAGITLAKKFTGTTVGDWERVMGVNLKSVFLTCRAAFPLLRNAGHAAVVNVASQNGLVGRPFFSVYGSSKAGVIVLSKSLACAWGPDNIRVNSVCPGSIMTPMLRSAFEETDDPEREEHLTSAITPMGRVGTADEVAAVIEFLASDAASFVTGQTICVDGGRTAGIAESFHWTNVPFREQG